MSRLTRALLRPARPLRTMIAGALLGSAALLTTPMPYAAGLGVTATTPVPTPSCKEWQTVTQVPVGPAPSPEPAAGGSTAAAAPTVPTRPMCRNAPPTPFAAPAWDPATVVGGEELAGAGVIVDKPSSVPAPPVVEDVSYVIADMESGEILAAKAPHAWLRPASTLKTLTALTLLPLVSPNYYVTATREHVTANGTRAGMIEGSRYKAGSLFDAMLMLSANDAVYALTDAVGGYDRAVELVNAKAKEIGAFDTVAVDPSGLDEDGQHSSAYDLALIGRAAMQREDFRTYVTKRQTTFPGGVDSTGKVYPAFQIPNINHLLGNYPGAIGVKPGRTNRAQYTFIGAATRGERTLIVSQMGSTSGSWKHTATLLDWGFANADAVTPVGRLVDPGEATPPSVASTRAEAPAPAVPATPTVLAAASGTPAPPPVSSSWAALRDDIEQVAPIEVVAGAALLLLVLVLLLISRRRRRSGRRRPSRR